MRKETERKTDLTFIHQALDRFVPRPLCVVGRCIRCLVLRPLQWVATLIGALAAFFLLTSHLSWLEFGPEVSLPADATPQDVANAAQAFWAAAHAEAGFTGHLLIQQNETVLVSQGYGHVDQSASADPIRETTTFYIGSLSKQMTAAVIYRFQEEGRLKVSDPVCRFVEHFCQEKLAAITIEHLMTQTSGLSPVPLSIGGFLSIYKNFWFVVDLESYVRLQSPDWLSSDPGTRFRYSNFGYDVLSLVIARVAGQPFDVVMNQVLKDDLGLLDTFAPSPERNFQHQPFASGAVLFHIPGLYEIWRMPMSWLRFNQANSFGSGSLISSTRDLAKWGEILRGRTFLNEESKHALWTAKLEDYASGWVVRQHERRGHRFYWHNGKVPGFESSLALFPESGLTVVWLSNTHTSNKDEARVIREFNRLVAGKTYHLPLRRRLIPGVQF